LTTTHVIAVNQGFETDLKQSTLEIADHLTDSHTVREDGNRPEYQRRKQGWSHFPVEIENSKDYAQCLSTQRRSKASYKYFICEIPLHPRCWAEYYQK